MRTPRAILRRKARESVEQRKRAEWALRIAKVLTEAEWVSEKKMVLRMAALLVGDGRLEEICREW